MEPSQSTQTTSEESFQVKVQTITGQTFPVLVLGTETVLDIKRKLEHTPGIEVAPDRQRLFFGGMELQDHLKLNEIPRLTTGSTISIFLRAILSPVTPDLNTPIPAEPFYQGAEFFYPQIQDNDAHGYGARVEKSALNIRLIGIFFVIMGLINAVVTVSSTPTDWQNISTGGMLTALGCVAIYAGVKRTTKSAKRYFLAIIGFICAFAGIFIANSIISDSSQSTSDILVTVLVGIFFPIFLCSFCAFCAKRHLTLCLARDEYDLQFRVVIPQVGIVAPGVTQPLLGPYAV